jgi:hypothetical protein
MSNIARQATPFIPYIERRFRNRYRGQSLSVVKVQKCTFQNDTNVLDALNFALPGWGLSRKNRNKLMHAINGNTATASTWETGSQADHSLPFQVCSTMVQ